jgi:hypothetical protein
MKQSINCHDFINAFDKLRPDNFSRSALILMFEYFEEYERDTGEEIEFDPIAICCEYSEAFPEEIIKDYALEDAFESEYIDRGNDLSRKNGIIEHLRDHTQYIGETDSGTLVFQQF